MNVEKIFFIPLGGVAEIGKNMFIIENDEEILIIDAGLMFPEEDQLGIDMVIPDLSYLEKKKNKVKGIIITHAHEDHIGALPLLLKKINIPVFATELTSRIIEQKIKENGLKNIVLNRIKPGLSYEISSFKFEPFAVNHSIPEGVGLAIYTPLGIIIHSGDFKIDQTPIDGKLFNFSRIAEFGKEGVILFISDCLNVEREGYTPSERVVGESFSTIFKIAKGRLIIATFASNIHRIQQAVDLAFKFGKRVAIAGKSMLNIVNIGKELGYLHIPERTLISLQDIEKFPANKIVILATGTQGEPMSALTKMARDEYQEVRIIPDDTVIISASPIPGNENLIFRTVNNLFKRGAEVIYEADEKNMHTSGHASKEELKLLLNILHPKFVVPFHGEYRHLIRYKQLAEEVGIPHNSIFILESGDLLEITKEKGRILNKVAEERILVDGMFDVRDVVLRDRKQLSKDGIFVVSVILKKGKLVSEPEIISRGFIYGKDEQNLLSEVKKKIKEIINKNVNGFLIKEEFEDALSRFFYQKTKRRPIVQSIIIELN